MDNEIVIDKVNCSVWWRMILTKEVIATPQPNDRNISRKHVPNIVGPAFASSGQTIATLERNRSPHCWAHNVSRVWPPCRDVLWCVGCCWLKFENGHIWANNTKRISTGWPNSRNMIVYRGLLYNTVVTDKVIRRSDFMHIKQNNGKVKCWI